MTIDETLNDPEWQFEVT